MTQERPLPIPQCLRDEVDLAAHVDLPVLLLGPPGSGKSTLAEEIHRRSGRKNEPFQRVDCAQLASGLAQSELAGHVRGAYTGAGGPRKGLARSAHRGTLFFDEISVASPADQARLLTIIEDATVRPLGSDRDERVDVRVIAATNADLEARIADASFRRDLYHRCAAMTITLPPLAERRDEFPEIVAALLREIIAKKMVPGRNQPPEIAAEVMDFLLAHPWPDNLRGLRHVLGLAMARARDGRIEVVDLPGRVLETVDSGGSAGRAKGSDGAGEAQPTSGGRYVRPEDTGEDRRIIVDALREGQSKAGAARRLGASRQTIYNRIAEYDIGDWEWRIP